LESIAMTAQPDSKNKNRAIDDIQAAGYRIISIGVGDRAFDSLTAELSAWQAASDEDFESFASGLE
jgi:hypothetical protein